MCSKIGELIKFMGSIQGCVVCLLNHNVLIDSDALIVGAINCCTSFVSGFAVFSALGYMALKQRTTVEEVAKNGGKLISKLFWLRFGDHLPTWGSFLYVITNILMTLAFLQGK